MTLVELTRLPTRARAEELRFILQGAGITAVVEPRPGDNGSPLYGVLVPEGELERARAILEEEGLGVEHARPAPRSAPRAPLYWVVGLVVANLLVWIAMEGSGGSERRQTLLRFGASHAPRLPGEWWRTVTAVFLHIGLRHLLANMFALAILGPAVLNAWGVGRFCFLYVAAGVAGNWISFALSPTAAVKAGASGSILGLLGVLAGTRIRAIRSSTVERPRFKTWHILAMLVAFYGFVIGVGHVDHLAHLGGLVVGGLLALLLPPPGRLPPRADRRLAASLGGSAALLCVAAGLLAWRAGP
jgi:rhomboid protease GluP